MTKRIPVRNPSDPDHPLYAIVDDEDHEWLSRIPWCAAVVYTGVVYAIRMDDASPGEHRRMHTMILGGPTDHHNRNGLDNRRSNLRDATASTNAMNNRKRQTGTLGKPTSSFKGVCLSGNRWRSRIRVEGRLIHLGYFADEIDAALAYDSAARIQFGEFARLNFPFPGEQGCLD